MLQFYNSAHSIVRYLVVIYEQLPQILKTVAYGEESQIADAVLSQNESFNATKKFDAFDVLIIDFAVRQIYYFSVWIDDNIFDGACPWTGIGVDAVHD